MRQRSAGGVVRDPAAARRAHALDDLALLVGELTDCLRVEEQVDDWLPTREHPDFADGSRALPRRPEKRVHRAADPGLLVQLRWAAGRRHAVAKPAAGTVDAAWLLDSEARGAGPFDMPNAAGKPESRPPCSLDALDALAGVEAEVRGWVKRLGATQGRERLPDAVRGLVGLAAGADPRLLGELVRDCRSWVGQARIVLGYDAPPRSVPLPCPECQGELRWHEGLVRCVGGGLMHGPPRRPGWRWPIACGAAWKREQWALLLDASAD